MKYIEMKDEFKAKMRKLPIEERMHQVEIIAGNLSDKIQGVAGLMLQLTRDPNLSKSEITGLGFLLEDLAREAGNIVTILYPGKTKGGEVVGDETEAADET